MTTTIKTLSGTAVNLTDEKFAELTMGFRGQLVAPSHDDYDTVRAVENRHIDRRPGLIIRCSGTADVIDGVNLAREHQLLLAVRAGGHHVAGHGVCDGGLVLDLRAMRGVWVDPARRRVRVQGGATWGDVDREAQAFGLAVPGGIVSTTGVAGLTLGGGIGWLHRKWGLACDALLSAEVITAEGRLVLASADENADLFWGLRGGGGNFGVVVSFEFAAQPLGPIVMAAGAMYPAAEAPELIRYWRDWATDAPDEITTRAMFWTMPAAPALPLAVHNRDVFIVAALYAGDANEGERALNPVRTFSTPLADLSGQVPYRMFQAGFDPLVAGLRSYWKSTYLPELSDTALDLICDRGLNRPDPKALVHVPLMGGATSRVGATDTAFGDRSAPWMLSVDGNWTDEANADTVKAWVRSFLDDAGTRLGAGGAYLNFSGEGPSDAGQVRAQFGSNLEQLITVKKKYDPQNLFRMNNNIRPE